ncbi:MAG: hypothetical protein AAF805_06865 [Planctomycetota bacterium]
MDLTLAAAEPTYNAWWAIGLLSRVTHTVCGATIVGGLLYLRFVLAPSASASNDKETALFAGRRRAWAGCVAACSTLLLVSGTYNLIAYTRAYENLPKAYHSLFGVKFLLALGVMLIAALLAGKTNLAARMRGGMRGWLSLAIVLAIGVHATGAVLRSYRDLPDARVAPAVVEDAPAFEFTDPPNPPMDDPVGVPIEISTGDNA